MKLEEHVARRQRDVFNLGWIPGALIRRRLFRFSLIWAMMLLI